ncbi:MAG: zinc ABC transporter substrate-binding protein [Chloroflexi bacterium]|nr:zinc ABC transporter substrate-binding protein [Chloroflexota bacterium]
MAMALFLQACGPSPSTTPTVQAGQLSVAATIYPVQFLAKRIGGDRVQVRGLVPTGVESHDWEPSPRDLRDVYDADVLVHTGTGFEEWVERLLRDLESDGPLVISVAIEVAGDDPHVWMDPGLYALQAGRVHDGLVLADSAGASVYAANFSALQDELAVLEAEMERGLATCDRNSLVVSHAAYSYLTQRFGLEQIGIAGVSPEVEPSPAKVRAVVEQVRSTGATHVLYETLVSPRIAQTIAEEAGVELLPLNPLEGLTEEQASAGADYFTVMRDNLATLRTALGCR